MPASRSLRTSRTAAARSSDPPMQPDAGAPRAGRDQADADQGDARARAGRTCPRWWTGSAAAHRGSPPGRSPSTSSSAETAGMSSGGSRCGSARSTTGQARARPPATARRSTTMLDSSIARVIGPTPPGLGETQPATSHTSSATSPAILPSTRDDADVEHRGARLDHVAAVTMPGHAGRGHHDVGVCARGRRGRGCRCGTG